MEPSSFPAISVTRRKQLSEPPFFPFPCLFQLQPAVLLGGLWGAEGREEGNCKGDSQASVGADAWVGFERCVEGKGSP